MMKVLFIDDEALIRRGFQAIISWNNYGFDKFYEAEDGQEGIDKINELNPELVLLDIRMQDIDGIEVSKQVREAGFKGRIIIISGYSDFKYAKAAISYDITAYLLKPVDTTELINAIQKAKEELERESLVSVYATQPINRSVINVINDLITGRLKYTSEITLAYGISFSGDYYRLIAIHSLTNIDKSDDIKDFLHKIKVQFPHTVLINGEVFILLSSKRSYLEYQRLQDEFITNSNPCELYFIQSDIIRDISNLQENYKKIAEIIISLFYYADSTSIYQFPCDMPRYNISEFDVLTQTQLLLNSVLTMDSRRIDELLSEYSYYLCERRVAKETIGFILGNSYQQIMTELLHHYPQLEIEFANQKSFLARLCEYNYLFEYINYFKKQLIKLIAFIRDSENRNPCDKLCRFIELNYTAPLKLEVISKQFGYNSSYLGKLFKKETGDSFNTYVDKIRIKYAKLYLEKHASVNLTASKVGFNDIDYFTKKFKKYEGSSPSEYKKKVLEEKGNEF